MESLDATDLSRLDRALQQLPNSPAVFLLWPAAGEPYLARTTLLRRRLLRMLGHREQPSRLVNLRGTVARIDYQLTGSGFESSIVFYQQARLHFPDTWQRILKLRRPPYVKILLANAFPRSTVTTHVARTGLHFGPFRSRASAERFEGQFLDLFQMRRCQEDLAPSPEHPGCIYGEMAMCLRPCQEVVGAVEYGHEVARAVEFLRSDGASLLTAISHSRDRLSEEMRFEDAARQHKRYEKVQEVMKLRDEMARDVDSLNGVAITPSIARDSVEMWFVREGWWQQPRRFSFEIHEGKPVPLDRALREAFASVTPVKVTAREREEYLALLARWFYASTREGEWIAFDSYDQIPYRKLVNAVSRVARREAPPSTSIPAS